jgi:hypothetical protein
MSDPYAGAARYTSLKMSLLTGMAFANFVLNGE